MPLILSIETATPVCSVALHDGRQIIGDSHLHIGQAASSKLAVMIDELLKRCDVIPSQLDAIAVSEGPGSYTGLRIGVATAKGMCYALSKPLLAVNTLVSMVRLMTKRGYRADAFCPMLDARRMEVYCLLADRDGNVVEETEAKVVDQDSFAIHLKKKKILFFGNGADKCREVILDTNAEFVADINPSAVYVGEIAFEKFLNNEFEDLESFEPFYLKDFLVKKPKTAV